MTLEYVLYPRTTANFAASSLAPAPGFVPRAVTLGSAIDGTSRTFAFSDIIPPGAAENHHPQASGVPVVVDVRLLWETLSGGLPSFVPVQLSEVRTPQAVDMRVRLAVTPLGLVEGAFAPVFSSGNLIDTVIASDPLLVAPGPNLTPGGGDRPVATQRIQFQNGRIRIWLEPDADGWDANTTVPFNLGLVVLNRDTTRDLRVVFTVTSADTLLGLPAAITTDLPKPWLHVTRTAQIRSGAPTATVRLLNYGTGDVGNIVAAPSGPDAGLVSVVAPPATLAAGTTADFQVGIASGLRTARGLTEVVVTSSSVGESAPVNQSVDDPAAEELHNDRAVADVDLGAIEIHFVLDASGSMSARLPGTSSPPNPANDKTRFEQLQTNVGLSYFIIESHAAAKTTAQLVIFPKHNGFVDSTTASEQVPLQAFPAFQSLAVTELGAISPGGATPLSAGIDFGLPVGPLPQDVIDGRLERWMLLMSDGLFNVGDVPSSRADELFAQRVTPLAIRLLETPATVDTSLNDLVTATNAQFTGAGLPGRGVALTGNDVTVAKSFISQVSTILGLSASSDPDGVVSIFQPQSVHEFTISSTDRIATFVIFWRQRNAERLRVQLVTSRCEAIESSNFHRFSGVTHASFVDGQGFSFNEEFLSGGGQGFDRFGTWRLIVTLQQESPESPESPGGPILLRAELADEESYTYALLTETALKLSAGLVNPVQKTGDRIQIRARLSNGSLPFSRAVLSIEVRRPVNSRSQFIGDTPVPPDVFERVRKELAETGVTDPEAVKAAALSSIGIEFEPIWATETLGMTRVADGVYEADAGIAAVDGPYDFTVAAFGDLRPGVPFRREANFNTIVDASLAAATTTICVSYGPGGLSAEIELRPRDVSGIPLVFDPATEEPLTLVLTNGAFTGPLTFQADGRYTRTASFDQKKRPSIEVFIPGNPVPIISKKVAHVPKLVFADTLFEQQLGREQKANEHSDFVDVLGPFDPNAEFLSLGAGGSVVLGARRATSPSEVCVFVRPDSIGDPPRSDPRDYAVDVPKPGTSHAALSTHPHGCGWVEIGRSDCSGCFSLEKAGRQPHAVVRIRDLSNRSRGPGGVALTTPGVSLFAVGFVAKRVASPDPDVDFGEACIVATHSISIGSRVSIREPGGASGILSNAGHGDTSVGAGSVVGNIFSAGPVKGDGATFDGNILTTATLTLTNGAALTPGHTAQEEIPLNLPGFAQFERRFQPGNTRVSVEPGQVRSLPPGSYAEVTVKRKGKLALTAGAYFFERLSIEPEGILDASNTGGVPEVYVRRQVLHRGVIQPKRDRANLLIVAAGNEDFVIEAPFVGTAVAIAGTLRLSGAPVAPGHRGTFCGKRVVVEPGWTIVHVKRS